MLLRASPERVCPVLARPLVEANMTWPNSPCDNALIITRGGLQDGVVVLEPGTCPRDGTEVKLMVCAAPDSVGDPMSEASSFWMSERSRLS